MYVCIYGKCVCIYGKNVCKHICAYVCVYLKPDKHIYVSFIFFLCKTVSKFRISPYTLYPLLCLSIS